MIIVTRNMRKKQKEVIEGRLTRPSNAYMDEVLTRINQEDVATFHSGKQGELDDVTKHVEPKLSKVNGKWLADVVELKTPWEPIWDPIENLAFW